MLSGLRYALRSIARRPFLSSILVLILGFGLGANHTLLETYE